MIELSFTFWMFCSYRGCILKEKIEIFYIVLNIFYSLIRSILGEIHLVLYNEPIITLSDSSLKCFPVCIIR